MGLKDFFTRSPSRDPLQPVLIPTVQHVEKKVETPVEPTYDKAKEQSGIARMYGAGEWDDLTADWSITPTTSFAVVHKNLSNLRARARAEYRKNDYARRFVSMLQTGVVGPQGFQLQAQFENFDGSLDTVANRAFEAHFKKWAQSKYICDVRKNQNFTAMQRQLAGQLATDGEILIRQWASGPLGYQLQVLDPQILDLTFNDINHTTGNRIRFGIEVNEMGAPVAYYLNKLTDYNYFTGERIRVPASQIYHVYINEMVDQYRGIPWLATPSYRMHMLDGMEEASLVNARAGASKMGFRRSLEPERYEGDEGAGSRGSREIELYAPGTSDELGQNEEWITHDPTYPQGEFKDYVRQVLRGVASGLSVSYPTLANDLEGVNYTSLRHDALQERDVYMGIQTWLADHLLQPIYNDWLMHMFGNPEGVPIPRRGGGSRRASAAKMEKFRKVHFQGRRWQWVDPLKEAQAQKVGIELGTLTREEIIRDTGRDPEEVLKNVEAERERFGVSAGEQQPGSTEQDSEADEDPPEGDQPGKPDD